MVRNTSNTVRILRRDGTTSEQINFVGDGDSKSEHNAVRVILRG